MADDNDPNRVMASTDAVDEPATSISDIVGDVLDVAVHVAPLIVPGAKPAIEAGRVLLGLLKRVESHAPESQQESLNAQLADLEARVFAHADETAENLRK